MTTVKKNLNKTFDIFWLIFVYLKQRKSKETLKSEKYSLDPHLFIVHTRFIT